MAFHEKLANFEKAKLLLNRYLERRSKKIFKEKSSKPKWIIRGTCSINNKDGVFRFFTSSLKKKTLRMFKKCFFTFQFSTQFNIFVRYYNKTRRLGNVRSHIKFRRRASTFFT